MYLTNAQIREIGKQLSVYGIKDTEFDTSQSLKDDDYVAIVQDGVNKKISIRSFVESVADEVTAEGISAVVVNFEVDMDTMHLHMIGSTDQELINFSLLDNGHLVYING